MTETQDTLHEAIATLPVGDSGEVFTFLLERGITGRRKEPCGCPVAGYLAELVWKPVMVSTTTASAGDVIEVLPDAVQTFIRRFDSGEFPELDASSRDV